MCIASYRGRLLLSQFDRSSWPPKLRDTRTIDLGGRSDRIAMSVDGRWLAYDGSQCSGIASVGQVADFGLNDLAEARITFERLAQPGAPRIEDVVVAGGQPAVLVSSEGADRTDREQDHTVTWLDRNGEANGQSVSTSPGKLTWLPRRARVLSDNQCQLELLDLPSRNADAARP